MHMTKVISISDDAYEALKRFRGEGESFSKAVMKLTEREKESGIMKFAGMWKDKPEMEKIFAEIRKGREKFKTRDVKL